MWMEWVYLLCLLPRIFAAPESDRIFRLPGYNGSPKFKQYSGYLPVESGNKLFYWFTAAVNGQRNAPVMLWLNGGPGCSSLAGLLSEMGPFRVDGDQLVDNIYSWNKYAHIIFLDAPAGVGFSQLKGTNYTFSDSLVARENYQALVKFFNKFDELRGNDFYIGGESYGGTYVPMLGDLVVNDKDNFPNFKGILIGNGCMNERLRVNSQIPFNHIHGLISESQLQNAKSKCCRNRDCDWFSISRSGSEECQKIVENLDEANFYSGLDPYLLDYVCYEEDVKKDDDINFNSYNELKQFAFAHRKPTSSFSTLAVKSCHHENEYVPYLNRKDVQKALHVDKTVYTTCSGNVSKNYIVEYEDMSAFIKRLVHNNKKVLLFNGDMDSVCTHLHNQQFLAQLNLELESDRKIWRLNGRVPKTAGAWTKYKGVDYITVNGGGHFVASTYEKPREALQLFYNFVKGNDYSNPIE